MDALSFLYWSLGGAVILLAIFICIALIYFIRILKDVSNATSTVMQTTEKMSENVARITDKVADVTDQVAEYVVKPLSAIQFLMEKIKPVMDFVQQKSEEFQSMSRGEAQTDYDDEEEGMKPKKKEKKGLFGRKLKKKS